VRAELSNNFFRHQRPLRALVEDVAADGHKISKDALHRHLRSCVAPPGDLPESTLASGALVAFAVATVLGQSWPSLARQVADELVDLGAQAAARVITSDLEDWTTLKSVLEDAPPGSDERAVFEARGLAGSVRRVLSAVDPSVATALAADLRTHGLDDLADATSAIHESDQLAEVPS
jgi:predicted component of type VI protein secretion system